MNYARSTRCRLCDSKASCFTYARQGNWTKFNTWINWIEIVWCTGAMTCSHCQRLWNHDADWLLQLRSTTGDVSGDVIERISMMSLMNEQRHVTILDDVNIPRQSESTVASRRGCWLYFNKILYVIRQGMSAPARLLNIMIMSMQQNRLVALYQCRLLLSAKLGYNQYLTVLRPYGHNGHTD